MPQTDLHSGKTYITKFFLDQELKSKGELCGLRYQNSFSIRVGISIFFATRKLYIFVFYARFYHTVH